jgi:two-component system, NarL family, response regulator LiaR
MQPIAAPKIRVFIVDDHPLIRTGLAGMIDAEPDFEHVGEAASGAEALQRLPLLKPDVVLMDLVMPGLDGIDAVAALSPRMPNTRFVILTSLADPDAVRRAMTAGACGFLLKTASAHDLVTVIRNAHAGRRVLGPEATDALFESSKRPLIGSDLTPRERELLALMARGMTNQAIVDELGVAMATVKFHVTNIHEKLGVENRTAAVLLALKHKLVPPT